MMLRGTASTPPAIGRFLTRDPSGAGDIPYAYCGNNPVSNLDPLGLQSTDGSGGGIFSGPLGYGIAAGGALIATFGGAIDQGIKDLFGGGGGGGGSRPGHDSFGQTDNDPFFGIKAGFAETLTGMTFGLYQNPTYANAPGAEGARILGGVGTVSLGLAGGLQLAAQLGFVGISWGGVGIATAVSADGGDPIDNLITVARWGRPGLEAGDWVMKGGATYLNWLLSFKWQPDWVPGGNTFTPFADGEEFEVPASTLHFPSGWGIDGWWKGLIYGQRIYRP